MFFPLLCFTDIAFFLQIEDLWQPCVKQVYWCHFSNSICSLHVSVSLFVNSCNISKFALLLYLLQWHVISNLWCYCCMYLASLNPQIIKGNHNTQSPYSSSLMSVLTPLYKWWKERKPYLTNFVDALNNTHRWEILSVAIFQCWRRLCVCFGDSSFPLDS